MVKLPVGWFCGMEHAMEYASDKRSKAKDKEQKKEWADRKKSVKPIKHWIDMTQRAVNDLRRKQCLAEGDGCISCGTNIAQEWHAGHYRTTAAASQLRFTHDNIWLQCASCNVHKSGNIERYRVNLIAKIGEDRVVALECNQENKKWEINELEEIRAVTRKLIRELEDKYQ